MDMFLPGISGLQLLTKLHGLLATTRIVVLTRAAGPGLSVIVIRSGASAFLTKASSGAEILHAVSEVLLGQQYVSPLARKDWGLGADESEAMLRLTARERTVIQLLARGMTNIEIGHLMAISPRGVHFGQTFDVAWTSTPTLSCCDLRSSRKCSRGKAVLPARRLSMAAGLRQSRLGQMAPSRRPRRAPRSAREPSRRRVLMFDL